MAKLVHLSESGYRHVAFGGLGLFCLLLVVFGTNIDFRFGALGALVCIYFIIRGIVALVGGIGAKLDEPDSLPEVHKAILDLKMAKIWANDAFHLPSDETARLVASEVATGRPEAEVIDVALGAGLGRAAAETLVRSQVADRADLLEKKAAYQKSLAELQVVLGRARSLETPVQGVSPMVFAIRLGVSDAVDALLKKGVELPARDPSGRPILHVIAGAQTRMAGEEDNYRELLQLLLARGADPAQRYAGKTLLECAEEAGNRAMATALRPIGIAAPAAKDCSV
jgi:hypothetical protein